MLSVYQVPNKKIGTVRLAGEKLEISDESNGLLSGLIDSMRKGLSDKVLYNGLMRRLSGRFYVIETPEQQELDDLESELTPFVGGASKGFAKQTEPFEGHPADESKLEAFKRKFTGA